MQTVDRRKAPGILPLYHGGKGQPLTPDSNYGNLKSEKMKSKRQICQEERVGRDKEKSQKVTPM